MQRYLVAINYDGPHEHLAAEVRALALADDAQFHIVVPAVARGKAHSEGEQRALAQQLLDSIESALDDVPVVDGDVGDANLFAAIGDELDRHPYDVLVIATPPIGEHEQARLVDRLVRLYGLPVIHVTATGSEWLQRHPLEFGLGLDQGTPHRGRSRVRADAVERVGVPSGYSPSHAACCSRQRSARLRGARRKAARLSRRSHRSPQPNQTSRSICRLRTSQPGPSRSSPTTAAPRRTNSSCSEPPSHRTSCLSVLTATSSRIRHSS